MNAEKERKFNEWWKANAERLASKYLREEISLHDICWEAVESDAEQGCRWVSVKERLPELDREYFTLKSVSNKQSNLFVHGVKDIGFIDAHGVWNDAIAPNSKVTHWLDGVTPPPTERPKDE